MYVAVCQSSDIGIYNWTPKKRATIATDNYFKVGYVCNVVVLFRTATVGSTLHILPCGTVSTFCIANLRSQTSMHAED